MSTLSPDRWKVVSPYLDQALTLGSEERAAWLARLQQEDPSLAADLKTLLEEHQTLARREFLERPPEAVPVQLAHEGQTIGAYTILSPIGQGGMGMVWLARRSDGRYERQVAVKFPSLAQLGGGSGERFKREGSFLGRLAHPHIAELIDAGVSTDGQPYLVLEHVDGDQIDRYCDEKGLDVEARVRLFLDVLAAVAHAHTNLIVHRDIKPSNVLVTADGQVKLLDFGIAKLLEGDSLEGAGTQLTREGGGAMTPEYAAPEQVTGGPVTTATDVYALGVLLYQLLTGEHPAGPGPHSAAELVKAIVETDPPRPSDVVRSAKTGPQKAANAAHRATTPDKLRRLLQGDLDTIVAKALKKEPRERYASATALADDLRRYLKHEPIQARPDTLAYRTAKFVRRNRMAVALATLAFAASIAGVVGTIIQGREARAQRDFAFGQLSRAEAINDLNSFLLSDAAPSGKPFTADDLLNRAEAILDRQQGSDANRVELLISIGRQFSSQEDYESSLRLLEKAYRSSRGLTEPSIRARAACALANAVARSSDTSRAEPLVQEGLRGLPGDPQYALGRVFCLLRGSEVSRELGRTGEGIERVQAAQRVVREAPFRSESLEMRILMDLAEAYREAGRNREAAASIEQAAAKLTSLGRDNTETAGTLFNNWGLLLDQLGRPLEAEKVLRRAIDIGRDDRGEETVSPILLTNYARVLNVLSRRDEAADYSERATAKAQEVKNEVAYNQSLLVRERIYREQGDLKRAAEVLSEAEQRLRKVLPPGHSAFGSIAMQWALQAQARGDLPNALSLINQGVEHFEAAVKAGGNRADALPGMLVRRSDIELQLHLPDRALDDASRAVEMLEKSAEPGTFSCITGRAYLTLGRTRQAQGKTEEARSALQSALDHLQSTLGADHPDILNTRQLLAQLDLQPQ
jgi:serine/threonine-protein kinase